MPPRFGIQAPKCARCEKSVYLAEQVIGPSALPYHKTCLTCVTCNKRLDSTLLLEHEGQPYCKNCHRAHLGTGKGGFSTAVPLNPTIPSGTHSNHNSPSTNNLTPSRNGIARDKDRDRFPISPTNNSNYQTTSIQSSRLDDSFNHDDVERDSLDLQDQVPMIRVTGRSGAEIPTSSNSTSTNRQSSSNQLPFKPSTLSSTSTSNINRDHTLERNVRSLDEAVSGSSEMPRIVPRTSTKQLEQSINENANGDGNQDEELDQDIGWDEEFREREREKRRLEKERQALYSRPENLPLSQGGGKPKSVKAGSNEYRQSLGSNAQHSQISFPQDPPPPSHQTKAFSSTIGSVSAPPLNSSNSRAPHDGGDLPEPKRKTLPGASHTAKIASPAPLSHAPISGVSSDQITSGIGKLGLGSSIAAAAGGTPLCARCEKVVYFAEQKTAAGRKWHRACLRCDSCSTTLEAGKLEEGPPSAADAASVKRMRGGDDSNVFCRTCYAKFFGPKGLGVGLSYPNRIGGH